MYGNVIHAFVSDDYCTETKLYSLLYKLCDNELYVF